MKKQCYSTVLAGVCAGAFCVGSAHAQSSGANSTTTTTVTTTTTTTRKTVPPSTYENSPSSRFYVGVDAGGALTADPKVKEFLGEVSPGAKVSLDPGVRVGFVGGYKLTDWLSVEGETGIIANNIKSITDASMDGSATLANVPFLLNARLELPHGKCPITPYIGGGAGGSATVLAFEHHIDINGNTIRGSDSDVVFAYQAFGGLRYAINDHMGVGLEYHYFATTGADWHANGVGSPNKIAFAGVQSHAISASFDYRF
jgi:opacity protein-like surface antigen